MEFDINGVLKDVITKLDSRLQACRNAGPRYQDAKAKLFDAIDKMGEASARAQGLPGAITTGRKLEMSEHHLYIMKDPESHHGTVVGFLKVGRKRLFVYDRHGQQWEVAPLCVLDFYVHESRQRMGCGRRLFDVMLKDERTVPQHLAVDRPSQKFASFLAKHYALRDEIPQVNNFVIFDGFFTKRPDGDFIQNRRNNNNLKPADYDNKSVTNIQNGRSAPFNNYNNKLYGAPYGKATAGIPSVAPRNQQETSLKDLNLNPRSANNSSSSTSPPGPYDDLRSMSAGSTTNLAANRGRGGAGLGPGAGLQLSRSMYSRHQTDQQPPAQAQAPPGERVAPPPNHQRPPSGPGRPPSANNRVAQRPPSASNRGEISQRPRDPPPAARGAPPREYIEAFNLHQGYQGRQGHLNVSKRPGNTPPTNTANAGLPPVAPKPSERPGLLTTNVGNVGTAANVGTVAGRGPGGYYSNHPALAGPNPGDTSWTVFGVLRKQNQLSARTYGTTRLW